MVSKFITCKRGANKENVWEHGNIGQFWKGTRTPLGHPHLNPITKWLLVKVSDPDDLAEKRGL